MYSFVIFFNMLTFNYMIFFYLFKKTNILIMLLELEIVGLVMYIEYFELFLEYF